MSKFQLAKVYSGLKILDPTLADLCSGWENKMGKKGNQIRCPKYHGKVGQNLGTHPKEDCSNCRVLKICEDRSGLTLDQALIIIEKEKKQEDMEMEVENIHWIFGIKQLHMEWKKLNGWDAPIEELLTFKDKWRPWIDDIVGCNDKNKCCGENCIDENWKLGDDIDMSKGFDCLMLEEGCPFADGYDFSYDSDPPIDPKVKFVILY